MSKLERITARDVDFAKWYTDIVRTAKLVEYSAIKGEFVFMPNGWAIWTITSFCYYYIIWIMKSYHVYINLI